MSVLTWIFTVTGALIWGAVILLALYALLIEPSASISYGCAICDWEIRPTGKRPWWVLRIRFRWHRGRAHGLWTQRAAIASHKAARVAAGSETPHQPQNGER